MSKIAFLYPGQGAQYVGMGKDLYENNAKAKQYFDSIFIRRYNTVTQYICSRVNTHYNLLLRINRHFFTN